MERSFAILPAAGRSVRMGTGGTKLLLPWGERVLIETVLANWRASRVTGVVLVVHPDDRRLAEAGRAAGAEVVVPAEPPPDMKASIRHGLQGIQDRWQPVDVDAWLVAPADMPLLTAAAIDAVLAEYARSGSWIVVPRYKGQRGHPVAFPWSLSGEVARLAVNEGVNSLLTRFPVREVEIPDAGILTDIDTPEDYRRLLGDKPV